MPAYNAAGTIRAAIDSVVEQTFADFELIVCDDASTDETASAVEAYADERIRLLRNKVNLGEGQTRDRAIQAATGKWIAVLDADDAWLPRRLELLLEAVGSSEDIVAFDDILICHHTPQGMVPWRALRGNRAFGTRGNAPRDIDIEEYIRSDRLLIKPIFPANAVLGRRLLHSSRRLGADNEYFIRLGILGLTFRYLPTPLYLYRLTPGSATANAQGRLLMSDCIAACLDIPGVNPRIHQALEEKILSTHRKERFHSAVQDLLSARFISAFLTLLHNPSILRIAPFRIMRQMSYQVHRVIHSGGSR